MISFIALSIKNEIKNLIISVLFLEMTMVGVFVILDVIWFYAFWELSLVPMLYIIGAYGVTQIVCTHLSSFLYTFAGSVLMLVGILYMGFYTMKQRVFGVLHCLIGICYKFHLKHNSGFLGHFSRFCD